MCGREQGSSTLEVKRGADSKQHVRLQDPDLDGKLGMLQAQMDRELKKHAHPRAAQVRTHTQSRTVAFIPGV